MIQSSSVYDIIRLPAIRLFSDPDFVVRLIMHSVFSFRGDVISTYTLVINSLMMFFPIVMPGMLQRNVFMLWSYTITSLVFLLSDHCSL